MPPHVGRGGWTWYTGSAARMYRVELERLLGLRLNGGNLTLDPCPAKLKLAGLRNLVPLPLLALYDYGGKPAWRAPSGLAPMELVELFSRYGK